MRRRLAAPGVSCRAVQPETDREDRSWRRSGRRRRRRRKRSAEKGRPGAQKEEVSGKERRRKKVGEEGRRQEVRRQEVRARRRRRSKSGLAGPQSATPSPRSRLRISGSGFRCHHGRPSDRAPAATKRGNACCRTRVCLRTIASPRRKAALARLVRAPSREAAALRTHGRYRPAQAIAFRRCGLHRHREPIALRS